MSPGRSKAPVDFGLIARWDGRLRRWSYRHAPSPAAMICVWRWRRKERRPRARPPARRASAQPCCASCSAASRRSRSSSSAASSRCARSRSTRPSATRASASRRQGALVEAAGLTRRRPARRPRGAAPALDDLVLGQVLGELDRAREAVDAATARSSTPTSRALIGQRFALGEEEQELFDDRRRRRRAQRPRRSPRTATSAGRASCSRRTPPIRTPGRHAGAVRDLPALRLGQRERASGCCARSRRRCSAGCSCCCCFQVPLAWSLARRLQRGHRERERLLASAVEASSAGAPADRRRPARRRRAGPRGRRVRARAAGRRRRSARGDADEARRRCATRSRRLRQGVRDLRTLLVEIHPPNLESAGLEAALSDLLSPLRGRRDRDRRCDVDERRGRRGAATRWSTAWRARRCATSQAHAEARRVRVARHATTSGDDAPGRRPTTGAASTPPSARARASDGPRRADAARRPRRRRPAARWPSTPRPGEGTTVELEVPAR